MTPIGETLRRERLKHNLDIQQISGELKIAPRFIEAIEDERFEKLPGGVFAKSFVRQYARLLGLDEEELASEVQQAIAPPPPPVAPVPRKPEPSFQFPLPRVERWDTVGDNRGAWPSSLTALAGVVVVMLLCSGVYVWWQRRPAAVGQAASSVTQHVQTVQAAAPPQPPVTAPEPAPVPADGQGAAQAPAPQSPAPEASAAQNSPPAPVPAAPADAAAAPPAPSAETPAGAAPAPPSDPNAAVRVQLTALAPVWVRAQADGKYVFSGTLKANESRTVEASDAVVLRMANSGNVEIVLNGKPIGAAGPKGEIRTVQLTPGGLKTLSAPKPVPMDRF